MKKIIEDLKTQLQEFTSKLKEKISPKKAQEPKEDVGQDKTEIKETKGKEGEQGAGESEGAKNAEGAEAETQAEGEGQALGPDGKPLLTEEQKKRKKKIQTIVGVGVVVLFLAEFMAPDEELEETQPQTNVQRPSRKASPGAPGAQGPLPPSPKEKMMAETKKQKAKLKELTKNDPPEEKPLAEVPAAAKTTATATAPPAPEKPKEKTAQSAPEKKITDTEKKENLERYKRLEKNLKEARALEEKKRAKKNETYIEESESLKLLGEKARAESPLPKSQAPSKLGLDALQQLGNNQKNLKSIKKIIQSQRDKLYEPPPAYRTLGPGLVYNCQRGHWACVNKREFFVCRNNQVWAAKNNKTPQCTIQAIYLGAKDCTKIQRWNINNLTKPKDCKDISKFYNENSGKKGF